MLFSPKSSNREKDRNPNNENHKAYLRRAVRCDAGLFRAVCRVRAAGTETRTSHYNCGGASLNSTGHYSPQPHYVKFYDDYTYFVMYNYPFEMIDAIINTGFKK